jgi:hypothetical protein
MDFTLNTYRRLLNYLQKQGFLFQTFAEFILKPGDRVIILRHDVDRLPENSLKFARIQTEKGILGSYYFRVVSESLDEKIIKEICSLGHEIGYHYEDLGATAQRHEGVTAEEELARLWKYYDYREFGIIGEPYFDINFDQVLYLTDTGRKWDGNSVNVRDKSFNCKDRKETAKDTKNDQPEISNQQPATFPKFHNTSDIIRSAEKGELPDRIMITFHPQRWADKPMPWIRELVWQNVKNVGKYFLVKSKA